MTTRQRILIMAASLCLAAPVRADDPAPKLELDTRDVDFGEVIQGAVVERTVKLHNRGTAPLVITQATASCDCAIGRFPTEPIPPGESGDLVLVFDSQRKRGMQKFEVVVYSNDDTQRDRGRNRTVLSFMGEVRSLYRVAPAGVFFGEVVRGGDPIQRVVKIRGQAEAQDGFTAKLTGALPDYLEATVAETARGVEVTVTLLPQVPRGELSHMIELETSIALQPTIEIPVVGIVTGKYHGPDFVQMLRVKRGEPTERRISVERRDGQAGVHVVGIDVDPTWLEVEHESISPERVDLIVRLAAQAPPGIFATQIRVHIEDPDFPLVEIPVFGHVVATVQVEPPALLLHPAARDAQAELTVFGGRVVGVRGPDGVVGEVLADGSEGPARVAIRIDLAQGKPPQRFALVLETDVDGEREVEVPVRLMPWD